MAFNLGGIDGGRRSRGMPAMAEINVTPFVDVALVLLIIFMITAHVMEYGLEINVPKTKSVAATSKEMPVVVQITKSGDLYLGKDQIDLNRLVDEIHSKYPGQTAAFIRADGQTPWDIVANVSSVLGDAKFAVNALTQQDDRIGKRR